MNESSIGRFELVRHLGRGGMGDVYLANDPERHSPVALKLIRLSIAAVDPEVLEAEQRGVELQRHLQSRVPEIAAVYNSGELEGFFFVEMEYIEGMDLAEVIRGGAIPVARAVELTIQLCKILESIQRTAIEFDGQTVIHSDIKPDNIRLQSGDRVRLLDFGAAKSLRLSRKFTRNAFGSIPYLAPERLAGEVVNAQTDLWAVCVVLYQMIAGYPPFPGESTEAVERRIRDGQSPEALPFDCPSDLRSILLKSLRADPTLRFADAAALRRHLEAFQEGHPLRISESTRRTSPTRPKSSPSLPHSRLEIGRPSEGRQRRSRLMRLYLAMALFVLVILAACCGRALSQGRAIEKGLAEPNADLYSLFEQYQQAKRYDRLELTLSGAGRALKHALVASADRTLDNFRADGMTTRSDWEDSLHRLRDAAGLDDPGEELQAKLALCEGQIARLDAEALSASDGAAAKQKWQEAVRRFEAAKAAAPERVEADLALASIYGDARTGFQDPKKLKETLDEAERRGASWSDQGRRALVTAYFRQAQQVFWRASRAQGKEQVDLLYQALDGYDAAVGICLTLRTTETRPICQEAREQQASVSQELASKGRA
jgi:hypothetical protein